MKSIRSACIPHNCFAFQTILQKQQQETYLNIRGDHDLLRACSNCYASLFTDRAIIYRNEKGFAHGDVALSIGIQQMVRSDRGSSGVIFTIDTETGFPDVVLINGSWGLGENVVQGTVVPGM